MNKLRVACEGEIAEAELEGLRMALLAESTTATAIPPDPIEHAILSELAKAGKTLHVADIDGDGASERAKGDKLRGMEKRGLVARKSRRGGFGITAEGRRVIAG